MYIYIYVYIHIDFSSVEAMSPAQAGIYRRCEGVTPPPKNSVGKSAKFSISVGQLVSFCCHEVVTQSNYVLLYLYSGTFMILKKAFVVLIAKERALVFEIS